MQVLFLLKWFDPKVFIFNFDSFWTDWGGNLNAAKHHARNSDGHNNDVSIKPSPHHHHPTDFHSSKPECVVSKLLLQAKKMYISSRSSEPRDLTAIYGHVQSEEEARPRQELFRVVFQHQPPSPSFLAVNFL